MPKEVVPDPERAPAAPPLLFTTVERSDDRRIVAFQADHPLVLDGAILCIEEDDLDSLLLEATCGYSLPIATGFDFGHIDPMLALRARPHQFRQPA